MGLQTNGWDYGYHINQKNKLTMQRIITLSLALLLTNAVQAQLYNNGATLSIGTGGVLQVNGAFTNKSGSNLVNNGSLNLKGNGINDQTMSAANNGTWALVGTSPQTLSGTAAYLVKHLTVNNAAGVTLSKSLKADGEVTFQSGIVAASSNSEPLALTSNGTISTTTAPSNTSHVNGYVQKEGTGAFDFPVGDGTRYQKIGINLTANGTGIVVKYNATDAASGTFATTGASATPLASYNTQEHWDISPLSTATGTVTVYWDDYKTPVLTTINLLKVAHKSSGNWLNESGTATGNTSAGSVTSSSLSTWSPFTLGITSAPLPISWLSFTGEAVANTHVLSWATASEKNNSHFDIERSTDGNTFHNIGQVKGNNKPSSYQFVDNQPFATTYYRLRQLDFDGTETYSKIVSVVQTGKGKGLAVYPNPVSSLLNVVYTEGSSFQILNFLGQQVLTGKTPPSGAGGLDVSALPQGTYILKVGAEQAKFIKQ
jgi:hypothetical protein